MNLERLEIFTDAVIAIIITVLMLELPLPKKATLSAILEVRFDYLAFATSFLICSLVWKQHHHLFRGTNSINGKVIWVNTALIFCITFVPHLTVFVADNVESITAEVIYGLFFLVVDFVYFVLYKTLVGINPENKEEIDALARKNGHFVTFIIILVGLMAGIFFYPPVILISCLFSLIMWMVPKKQKALLLTNYSN